MSNLEDIKELLAPLLTFNHKKNHEAVLKAISTLFELKESYKVKYNREADLKQEYLIKGKEALANRGFYNNSNARGGKSYSNNSFTNGFNNESSGQNRGGSSFGGPSRGGFSGKTNKPNKNFLDLMGRLKPSVERINRSYKTLKIVNSWLIKRNRRLVYLLRLKK